MSSVVIWAYGDSLTAGLHSCPAGAPLERCSFSPYAPALEAALHAAGHATAVVRHIGYSGWTSEELVSSPRADELQPDLRFVLRREPTTLAVLLAGSNDLGRRRGATEAEIADSIWKLHALAHERQVPTVLIGIPPTGYGMGVRDARNYEDARRSVNALLRDQCAATAPLCSYVGCPVAWSGTADPHWESDGVHMSPHGYETLGRGIAPAVAKALDGALQLKRDARREL